VGREATNLKPGKYLSLWFRCSNTYSRAYPNPDQTEYCGRCTRSGKTIAFPIGASGTNRRMFEVSCD
jgi:hypothetical protein